MTDLTLIDHDGEPRVQDIVLGKKLGLARLASTKSTKHEAAE